MRNVVVDTNVIVSAFLSSHKDVATVLVLKELYNNELILWYSEDVLEEYKDVLNREKFKFDKKEIGMFINFVLKKGKLINPIKTDKELIDKKDLPFYEIVMDKRILNPILITGNIKHFPVEPFIITPSEYIKTIDS